MSMKQKPARKNLLALLIFGFATAAIAAYQVQTVPEIVYAANNLLDALTPEQQAQLRFGLTEDERTNFHFTPVPRNGLPLKEMTPAQQKLAHALIAATLSQRGYLKATSIMSLEQILHEIEGPNGRFTRDPDLYFISMFGEPSATGAWGLRIEGHHLSLNFTMRNGEMIAHTPAFMGTNPAVVRDGPRAGLRVLHAEEDLGRALVMSLNDSQRGFAVISEDAPRDILSGERVEFDLGAPVGLPASALTTEQYAQLIAVIEEYAYRMPAELAALTMAEIMGMDRSALHFAWAGALEPGALHYYRVHSPAFLIEYDNTQNNGNHVHSVWRDLRNDFGLDLLAQHYAEAHAVAAQ